MDKSALILTSVHPRLVMQMHRVPTQMADTSANATSDILAVATSALTKMNVTRNHVTKMLLVKIRVARLSVPVMMGTMDQVTFVMMSMSASRITHVIQMQPAQTHVEVIRVCVTVATPVTVNHVWMLTNVPV